MMYEPFAQELIVSAALIVRTSAGVLAFSVRSRTSGVGIRMSLGADTARVRRMVLGEGGAVVAAGLSVGAIGALFAARVLPGILFGVTPAR